jgi:hypothetical protein
MVSKVSFRMSPLPNWLSGVKVEGLGYVLEFGVGGRDLVFMVWSGVWMDGGGSGLLKCWWGEEEESKRSAML